MPKFVSFGTWLRQRRRSLDLTQKALAKQVGCAEITVRRMEADEYKPSHDLALVLLDAPRMLRLFSKDSQYIAL